MENYPNLEALEFLLKHPYGSDAAYPYRYYKCKKMIERIVPESIRETVLQISPCECFLIPSPEPQCSSVHRQSSSLL